MDETITAPADELAQIAADRRRDYKTAEWYLLHYEQEAVTYCDHKAEFLTIPADENGGRRGGVGKPTEARALASVTYDEQSDVFSWLRATDIAIRGLCDSKRILIRLRRDAMKQPRGVGRPSWVVWVTMRYGEWVGRHVAEVTVKRWVQEIVWRIVDIHLRIAKKII